jgi:hypothetical protein
VTEAVGAAAGSGGGSVALDERDSGRAAEDQKLDRTDQPAASARIEANAAGDPAPASRSPAPASRPPAAKPAPKLAKRAGTGGIELRSPELQPKDVDDDSPDTRTARSDDKKAGNDSYGGGNAKPSPVPTAAIVTRPATSSPPATAAPSAGASAPDQIANADGKPSRPSSAKTVSRGAPAQAPSDRRNRAPGGGDGRLDADAGDGAKSAEENASDKALVAWVRKQHDLVVTLVKASNCRAAASAAVEIYSRAPGYYDANVTNDRSVKPCLAYLNSEREREERKFAAKRANSVESAPAPAAAPPPAASPPVRK